MPHNGSLVGTPTFGTGGKFGNALTATGDTNYISLPSGTVTLGNNFTLEAWLKVPSGDTATHVAFCASQTGNVDYFGVANGHFAGSVSGTGAFAGGASIASSAVINDGLWHHCVLQMSNGTTLTMYVDGLQVSNSTGTYAANGDTMGYIGRLFVTGYGWNGGIDEVAGFNYAKYSGNSFPIPTAPYTGTEPGMLFVYHLETNATDSIGILLAANSPFIQYSPGNWSVTSTKATSINAGSYFSLFFTGTGISLNFDVSALGSPASQIYTRIDGYETQSPFIRSSVVATVAATMPADTTSAPYHLLEVIIKSTSENINRWGPTSATAVNFLGATVQQGAVMAQTFAPPNGTILIFGDSIVEGVRTVNETATNDTDRNDSTMGWALHQRRLLGVDVGIIGFGAQGITVSGSGSVPAFQTAYPYLMSGVTRPAVPNLKLIVIAQGLNDYAASVSAATLTTGTVTMLNGLLNLYPGVPIAVMRTFGGYSTAPLQAGIAQCSNPNLVTWVDTTGFLNSAYGLDSLGAHPKGPNNLAMIAPQVAAKLANLLKQPLYSYS